MTLKKIIDEIRDIIIERVFEIRKKEEQLIEYCNNEEDDFDFKIKQLDEYGYLKNIEYELYQLKNLILDKFQDRIDEEGEKMYGKEVY